MRASAVRRVLDSPYGAVKVAAVYGPFIWMVMSLAVIPLLAWGGLRLFVAVNYFDLNAPFYGTEFTLAHASPRQPIWEYITSVPLARANFAHFETPFCLVGHTHVPAIYAMEKTGVVHDEVVTDGGVLKMRDGRRYIVNPGSIGQPRDSDPRAAYAIFDTDSGEIHFHRTEYDIAETQKRMTAAQLPVRLIMRLNFGW